MNNIKSFLVGLHQRPISFFPIYADLTGDVKSGLLLSQLMYWFSAVGGREFYKTNKEISEETRLSIDELKSAKRKLKALPFIYIKLKGVPAKTWYNIDLDLLIKTLSEADPSSTGEIHQLGEGNSTNSAGGFPPTNTETTQENTTEKKSTKKRKVENRTDLLKKTAKEFNLEITESLLTLWTQYKESRILKTKTDFNSDRTESIAFRAAYKKSQNRPSVFGGMLLLAIEKGWQGVIMPYKFEDVEPYVEIANEMISGELQESRKNREIEKIYERPILSNPQAIEGRIKLLETRGKDLGKPIQEIRSRALNKGLGVQEYYNLLLNLEPSFYEVEPIGLSEYDSRVKIWGLSGVDVSDLVA